MQPRAAEIQQARVFSAGQVLFPHISYTSFTYPGDELALAALKRVPGAPRILLYLQKNFTEQLTFVENNEQMVRAGARNYNSLYKLVTRCSEVLSCPVPELYITNDPALGAYTAGHRRTCLVLHSALIEAMTADELSFVIGHELGHIKCGHGLYRQLGDILLQYWDGVASLIPGVGLVRIPLLTAFWEWFRRAELTCDRAGLLCVQAVQPAMTALGKLAGRVAGFEDEFDVEAVMAQSTAHKEVNKLVQVVCLLNHAQHTHPFIPSRLKQLREYSDSEDYGKILRGEYERDPLGQHEGGLRMTCECGMENNIKLNFCPKCGRPVGSEDTPDEIAMSRSCANCGNALAFDVRFCSRCGARQETVVEELRAAGGATS
jgi:Zn-dependent protease with chaperone function